MILKGYTKIAVKIPSGQLHWTALSSRSFVFGGFFLAIKSYYFSFFLVPIFKNTDGFLKLIRVKAKPFETMTQAA